ncbi:hypothetical protein, partial [Brevundimonas naejangsanensis]
MSISTKANDAVTGASAERAARQISQTIIQIRLKPHHIDREATACGVHLRRGGSSRPAVLAFGSRPRSAETTSSIYKTNEITSFSESQINYVRTFSKRSTRGQSFFTLSTPSTPNDGQRRYRQ